MAAEVLGPCIPVSDKKVEAMDWGNSPLCTTMSAPHLNGYWRGGGPNVASISSQPPASCTLSA